MIRTLPRGAAVQAVLDDAVAHGLTPGAVASIVRPDGSSERFTSGHKHDADDDPVNASTIYDLASLTKLLCTTALVAKAVDEDVIALDEQPFARWPGVTVAHLLQHTSGLCAHRPLHELAIKAGATAQSAGRVVVVEAALQTIPEAAPGKRTLYSDLGFIALGSLLEERHGKPLDELFTSAAPTGLRFVNLWREGYHPAVLQTAPTERCAWRRRAVHGQVHDENAFAMGGVAGHAGLFGSLVDVEGAALSLMRAIKSETTLRMFARAPGERGLGFDKATRGGSTGDALGPATVGHLGFTGTSIWIDPDYDDDGAAFVLLANTLFPTREGVLARNKELRRAFHRAAALGEVG
ncbi:MAG: serine hydrolase domain-containing protein [Deltaproteobacteria bacterium]|nr:serine hydrolase domain-containing protein [Deltaproteobacteria bacterium]